MPYINWTGVDYANYVVSDYNTKISAMPACSLVRVIALLKRSGIHGKSSSLEAN